GPRGPHQPVPLEPEHRPGRLRGWFVLGPDGYRPRVPDPRRAHDGHDRDDEGLRLYGTLEGGGRWPPHEGSEAREAPGPLPPGGGAASTREPGAARRGGGIQDRASPDPRPARRALAARRREEALAQGPLDTLPARDWRRCLRARAADERRRVDLGDGLERDHLTGATTTVRPCRGCGARRYSRNDGLRPDRARLHRRPVPGLRAAARAGTGRLRRGDRSLADLAVRGRERLVARSAVRAHLPARGLARRDGPLGSARGARPVLGPHHP